MRDLRKRKGYTQEDMIPFRFSARHWQQIESGRPITFTTGARYSMAREVDRFSGRLVRLATDSGGATVDPWLIAVAAGHALNAGIPIAAAQFAAAIGRVGTLITSGT